MDDRDPELQLVHLLRAVAVELDLFAGEFAGLHGLHPTDVRALIHLLDAAREETPATPGWLGAQLGVNSASTTALVDRLERLDDGFFERVRRGYLAEAAVNPEHWAVVDGDQPIEVVASIIEAEVRARLGWPGSGS